MLSYSSSFRLLGTVRTTSALLTGLADAIAVQDEHSPAQFAAGCSEQRGLVAGVTRREKAREDGRKTCGGDVFLSFANRLAPNHLHRPTNFGAPVHYNSEAAVLLSSVQSAMGFPPPALRRCPHQTRIALRRHRSSSTN